MTLEQLIRLVSESIRRQFYRDRDREFYRDRQAISQSIARYGYECHRRNWEFSPDDICRDLMDLLRAIQRTRAEIEYFPIYLEGAVDRHVRTRAEELSSRAKLIAPRIDKVLANLKLDPHVRPPTTCEVLSAFYLDLKRKSKVRRVKPKTDQPNLL
jgi:hypothetical protein